MRRKDPEGWVSTSLGQASPSDEKTPLASSVDSSSSELSASPPSPRSSSLGSSPGESDNPFNHSLGVNLDFSRREDSDSPEHEAYEFQTPKNSPSEALARKKLKEVEQLIWLEGTKLPVFGIGTSINFGVDAKGNRLNERVTSTLAQVWEEMIDGLNTNNSKSAMDALASIEAIIESSLDKQHGARDQKTQEFYTKIVDSIKKTFIGNLGLQEQYNLVKESKTTEIAMRDYDQVLEVYKHNKSTLDKYENAFKQKLGALLDEIKPDNLETFARARSLLEKTIDLYSKTAETAHRKLYKEDILRVLDKICPDEDLRDIKLAYKTYTNQHEKMVTDLGSRFNTLYLSVFLNSTVIAIEPLVGGYIPIPSDLTRATLGGVSSSNLGSGAALGLSAAAPETGALSQQSPIMEVKSSMSPTGADLKQRWDEATSDKNKKRLGIRVATAAAGFAVGSIGTPALGAVVSAAASATVSTIFLVQDHLEIKKGLDKLSTEEGLKLKAHNNQFASVMNRLTTSEDKDETISRRIKLWQGSQQKVSMELSSPRSSSAKTHALLSANPPTEVKPPVQDKKSKEEKSLGKSATDKSNNERYLNPKDDSLRQSTTGAADIELQDLPDRRPRLR